jgi:hypothetical protein
MTAHQKNQFRPSCQLLEDRCVLSSGAAVHEAIVPQNLPLEVERGKLTLAVGHDGEEVFGLHVGQGPGAVEEWGLLFSAADPGLLAKAERLVGKEVIVTSPLVFSPDLVFFRDGLEIDADGPLIVEKLQAVDATSDATSVSVPPSSSRNLSASSDMGPLTQSKSPPPASLSPITNLLQPNSAARSLPAMTLENVIAAKGVVAAFTGSGNEPGFGAGAMIQHKDSWRTAERITADQPRHVRHSDTVPITPLAVDEIFSSL